MTTCPAYTTDFGAAFVGDARSLLQELDDASVNLFMTSPPFALQREKDYGNVSQEDYVDWLAEFAKVAKSKLREDGSLVLDIGGAYQRGLPVRSLYPFRVLLRLCDEVGFHLAEDFYWHNPSKLPSPIEWVNKRKIRAKDSVNTVWWLSRSPWPKADVRNVLVEYSDRMKKLLQDPAAFYDPARRPSGHDISDGFGRDNGGAIPPNLLEFPNSESAGRYLGGCRVVGSVQHPARFPPKLPEFFIKFLTDPGDLVVDFFAGSNTTGMVAEAHRRRWMAFELDRGYVASSVLRFVAENEEAQRSAHARVLAGERVVIESAQRELSL